MRSDDQRCTGAINLTESSKSISRKKEEPGPGLLVAGRGLLGWGGLPAEAATYADLRFLKRTTARPPTHSP